MIHRAEKGVDQIRKKVIIRKTKSRRRKKKFTWYFKDNLTSPDFKLNETNSYFNLIVLLAANLFDHNPEYPKTFRFNTKCIL